MHTFGSSRLMRASVAVTLLGCGIATAAKSVKSFGRTISGTGRSVPLARVFNPGINVRRIRSGRAYPFSSARQHDRAAVRLYMAIMRNGRAVLQMRPTGRTA